MSKTEKGVQMGCDIHMYVERKGPDDKWHSCDYFIPTIYWKGDCQEYNSKYTRIEIFGDRNYALFATIANVRNYGDTDYICEPKGFPNDASEYVKSEYENDELFVHSASYLTLQELIDFQNEKHPLKRRGMISPNDQYKLDKYGIIPDCWCQGTNEAGFEFREWAEDIDILEPLIDELKKRADLLGMIYNCAWTSCNVETRNSAYRASANIRIVFWFDN